ncbi:hypothetical protein LTR17_027641 [Elasticomyces elasticus]|nr:hypothetical protein LTR17_027641 [Elasticomyces elasticus]
MHKFADWTTFLEGVIPNLDNIPPVTKARVQNRRQLLKKIYTVARMEEDYKKFDMNGQYHYKEELKASVVVSKKRRRSAVPKSSARVSDGGALNPRSSDEGSVKRPCRQVEPRAAQASSTIGSGFDPTGHLSSPKTSRGLVRPTPPVTLKQQSTAPTPAHHDLEQMDVKPALLNCCGIQSTEPTVYGDVGSALPRTSSVAQRNPGKMALYTEFHQHHLPQQTGPDVLPATSFNSSSTEQSLSSNLYHGYPHTQLIPIGVHDHGVAQQQMPQARQYIQAFHTEVPEPQFRTVPNTHLFLGMASTYPMLPQDYQQPDMQQLHPFVQTVDHRISMVESGQHCERQYNQALPLAPNFANGVPTATPPEQTGLAHPQAPLLPQHPVHGMPIMASYSHPTYTDNAHFVYHPQDQLYHY